MPFSQLESVGALLTALLVRLVLSVVLIGLAYLVVSRVPGLTDRLLGRTGAEPNARVLLSRIIQVGIWVAGGIAVLGVWGIELGALAAGVGLFSLAISIALQDVLRNWVVGLYLLIERPFRIGDRVLLKDSQGVIEDVQLRVTRIRADDGRGLHTPTRGVLKTFAAVRPRNPAPPTADAGDLSGPA